jgi:N-sulfoglucosamine sulfohydrolase
MGVACGCGEAPPLKDMSSELSVLLITVDDMSWDSVGAFGCRAPDVTPNIDGLAREGIRFEHAHVNISVCQPCRAVLATGRYPHRNGVEGFEHTNIPMPTVMQTLEDVGYMTGILSKVDHSTPHGSYRWDLSVPREELHEGRSPEDYYAACSRFFEASKWARVPFFLMANVEDPHRPFCNPKSANETILPSRLYAPEEVPVPGFLPDLPDIRGELVTYYNSVKRADDTVGAILRALGDSGREAYTLVVFMSDNGMSFPFAKANCYPGSTRTPWIMRWPGVVEPGRVDKTHLISTIDFLPTVLDAARLPLPDGMDGLSCVPILKGGRQGERRRVYTQFHKTISNNHYPMRSVQDRRYCYIFNPWADGIREFKAEALSGRTFPAMEAAAAHDPSIADRVAMLQFRVTEELYDLRDDPDCLTNLVDSPAHRTALEKRRELLRDWMASTGDTALTCFDKRDDGVSCGAFVKSLEQG